MAQRFVGLPAPDFEMETALGDGENFGTAKLSDYKGKWLIMFFYPLDFTFVCPTEITAMSDAYDQFKELDAELLAVSTDSKYSHRAWINTPRDENGLGKLNLAIASDNTHKVSQEYGVYIEEQGVALRGLFIIDPDGVVMYSAIHNLDVGRSVDETLRVLQAFQSGGLCPANWRPGQALLKG